MIEAIKENRIVEGLKEAHDQAVNAQKPVFFSPLHTLVLQLYLFFLPNVHAHYYRRRGHL